jgi:hypothetical protein
MTALAVKSLKPAPWAMEYALNTTAMVASGLANARSQRTRYDYIVCGPLAKTRYCSDTSNVLGTVNATYDKVGNLLTISDDRIQSGPLYTRSYDALNRLSAVQSHYIPGQPST